jgi:ice-binding like protein
MKTTISSSLVALLLVASIVGCKKEPNPIIPQSNSGSLVNSDKSLAVVRQTPVNLGLAGEFAILSKTGITDVYKSTVTGDIGSSPITGAAILLTCAEVTGTIYSVDAAGPACEVTNASRLTTSVGDMQTAYNNAAGRVNPDFLNLGAGSIGGLTLTPGLYKWTTALNIPTNITISGSPTDVWIFQVAGTLNMSSAVSITLSGGAQAKNIFWQVAGAVTLGTTSHCEGTIMGQTAINLLTDATINGRLLAQTAVTLEKNTVTQPPVNLIIPTNAHLSAF